MPDREFLRRIDAHMERGNLHMEQGNLHMERGNVLMERIDAHMERGNELMEQNRRAFEDLRTFLRDMTLRQERVLGRMADHLADMTQEQRAQRAALFRILDRLDDGGSAAGA